MADSGVGKFRFNEVAKKKIGRGDRHNMQFWSDLWLGNEALKLMFPSLYELLCELKTATVAEMGECHHEAWMWKWDWSNNLQGKEAACASALKELLHGIGPTKDTKDRWAWLLDTVRGFLVKSCYLVVY